MRLKCFGKKRKSMKSFRLLRDETLRRLTFRRRGVGLRRRRSTKVNRGMKNQSREETQRQKRGRKNQSRGETLRQKRRRKSPKRRSH